LQVGAARAPCRDGRRVRRRRVLQHRRDDGPAAGM